MADLTYKEAQLANELVPGAPGAGEEQITGNEVVGATSATDVNSGWTFNNLKAWIKLDADWMAKSTYDSDGDGIVDAAESLNDGSNVVTAAQARAHLDNTSIHFTINDGSISANTVWSSSKINTELGNIVQFPEAPNDGSLYARDGLAETWEIAPLTPVGGMFLRYNWSSNTANSDPGSGNVKCNNADFKLATVIYVSATTRSGNDAQPVWSEWKVGDYLTLQHDTNGTFNAYQVSGPITDNTSWYAIPVSSVAGGSGMLANGQPVTSTQVLNPSSRVPAGGTIGQALTKNTNSDWDAGWSDVGDVVGPGSAVDANLAVFSGITGKLIADGNIAVSAVLATSVNSQLAGLAQQVTPVNGDRLLLEDATTGEKKYFLWSQLPSGGGGGDRHVIQDEGIPLPDQPNLNFIGATIQATENAAQSRIDVTVSAIDGSGVTFENLSANGDVGTGADQVAQGDHLHPGVYDPAGSAAAVQSNLDTHVGDNTNPHNVTAAQAGAEPVLGNPASDGRVLSSSAAGSRFWIPQILGGGYTYELTYVAGVGSGDPGQGNFRFNHADPAQATRVFLSSFRGDGAPINPWWQGWHSRTLLAFSTISTGETIYFEITSEAIEDFGHVEFDVFRLEGGTESLGAGASLISAAVSPDTAVPPGGLAGQVLKKLNDGDYSHTWQDESTGGGIPEAPDNAYGYVREGATSNQWVRGARVFEAATEPAGMAVGDFWIGT